jgi:sulfur transfer complex TusBCD TusB component (DsrH family)
MIKNIFILIFCFFTLYAEDINLTDFNTRQTILQDIKKVVQSEESIARAYEQYILDKYAIPSNISNLYVDDYLVSSSSFSSVINDFSSKFNSYSIDGTKISYALNDLLKADNGIKALYEGNTFRKKTYLYNSKIYFILEDAFAKHLYDLITQDGTISNPCSSSSSDNCVENSHIYISPTYDASGEIDDYLMAYHIDNFKKGPIVITSDTSLHSEDEFDSISKGALLIDTTGIRYVKTTSGIEALQ